MSLLGGVLPVFWRKWLLAMVLLASGGLIAVAGSVGVGVALDADGRALTITAPGLSELRGGFSATVEVDGQRRVLSSVSGMVVGERESATEATPYGEAAVTMVVRRFEKEGLDLLFRLGQVPGVSGVILQAGLRNRGTAGVKLIGLAALTMDEIGGLRPRGQPENWLVTGWDAPGLKITALNEIKTPLEVWEGGGFYRGDGSGFFFGPVGAPTAYVVGRFTALEKDRLTFSLSAEMSGVRVDAGETRWGQQVVLLMEKPVHAMGRWAEWVAKTH